MIVVDTNVIACLHLPTARTMEAVALLSREPTWAVPYLWRSEFRNVLAGYLRRGTMIFEQACQIQREAERLVAGSEYSIDSRSVLELVRDSECTAYDCEFVALAIGLDTKLITMDQQLLRVFPSRTAPLAIE